MNPEARYETGFHGTVLNNCPFFAVFFNRAQTTCWLIEEKLVNYLLLNREERNFNLPDILGRILLLVPSRTRP